MSSKHTWMLVLSSLLFTGCTTYHFKELSAADTTKYANTQPGYHKLADRFSIEVDKRLTRFYRLEGQKRKKTLLGTVRTVWFDFSDYGPREIVYAISADGSRLLFYDEPGVEEGRPDNLKNGVAVANLYIADADGSGKVLLYKNVHRLGVSCVDFPPNVIRFGKVLTTGEIQAIAFSTESQALSLEERRRILYKRKQQNKVCGPL